MADRWTAPGGWRVQIVHLEGTPGQPGGEWLRVTQYGWWTADMRTVAELERFFLLTELELEEDALGAAAGAPWRIVASCANAWLLHLCRNISHRK
jgi:hypothetical protein